ncbi:HNH endonuclease, partial [uncultured Phycicoccus sp.]|uniref:HNH endonuclease n=1 Tax=uncultured Phycicoccus sp. TaxID=661422 RepID=UPI00345C45FA
LVLRDDVCTTPWCDAPIVHADHTHPAHAGGETSFGNGSGLCARCNGVKEAPGWQARVLSTSPRHLEVTTPTGHTYHSHAPPLLGWGTDPPAPEPDPASGPAPDPDSPLERHLQALLHAA